MSPITTYILDTATGKPGADISVVLERKTHTAGWQAIAEGVTDADGRINDLLARAEAFLAGHYRLVVDTGPYYLTNNIDCFFPQITVSFIVKDTADHYHVTLLISRFGYTAYRGA